MLYILLYILFNFQFVVYLTLNFNYLVLNIWLIYYIQLYKHGHNFFNSCLSVYYLMAKRNHLLPFYVNNS